MKAYLLLWRDTAFQTKKAILLNWDGRLSNTDFETFKQATKQEIVLATERVEAFVEKQMKQIQSRKKGIEKVVSEWDLQEIPWNTYNHQISKIKEQFNELNGNF
ncbi:MAG: hypothetical protein HC803_04035 [Saprospiraceae bacterium]|nr:hypothetical protein [Saprospiraceae bacterium]